ncbi:3-deoxy-manno-octulosonate cytidylyltransferase [Croceiramulus getboli]|nr:3-deoxy-manno-octulosonate cytidylyltransferase [Flavobacteriaceae bacterium YJPT1-3]
MKVIAMIPARYAASRFPGKLMKDLGGKPVIVRTYEAAVQTGLFDQVYVVTDSQVIEEAVSAAGGTVLRSETEHETGSDRIAEAVKAVDTDIVINVQGDEPFTDREDLEKLIAVFHQDTKQEVDLASVRTPLTDWDSINNPNVVKVICDQQDFALYFSRAPLPFPRDTDTGVIYFKHRGIYAFRKQALLDFSQLPMGVLEASEKIECIRYLEYGKRIKMVASTNTGIGIDTPQDLEQAQQRFKQ